MGLDQVKESLSQFFFAYSTTKVLRFKSKKAGAVKCAIQLTVILYIIGYVCIWKKGYQDTDKILSSVSTKVKGIAVMNSNDTDHHIWDVADYVIPPQGKNSFFVLTNLIMTKNQREATCAEIPNEVTVCSSDEDCTAGIINSRSHGEQTGKCVNFSDTVKTCEIFAWCPLEIDDKAPNPPVLTGTESLTVLVRNNIRFPKFNFTKRNILPHIDKYYLERCLFNRTTDPHCPNFRLKDIVDEAGEGFQTMAIQGGVMGFQIRWDCNLDKDESLCVPQYKFRRIDKYSEIANDSSGTPDRYNLSGGPVKTGYNFRYAEYNNTGHQKTRTLIKAYGIRFDIMVFGQAGKFSIIPTLSNIGAGLGLLGLVTLLCDLVVLNCFPQRKDYREHKYSKLLKVSGEDPTSSQHEQNPQQVDEMESVNETEEVA